MTDINAENQWLKYIEKGKDVPNAVKPRGVVDIKKALRTKYPGKRIPTGRIVRTFSVRQRKAINQKV